MSGYIHQTPDTDMTPDTRHQTPGTREEEAESCAGQSGEGPENFEKIGILVSIFQNFGYMDLDLE